MTIKSAGIVLMIGVVLSFVSGLFFPGNALIDPRNQLEVDEAIKAIRKYPELAQAMIVLSIGGMMFTVYAFVVGIYPLTSNRTGTANTLLRFGIILSALEWGIILIGQGMRHIVVHGVQLASRSDNPEALAAASDVYVNMIAVFMSFIPLFPLASIMVGIGLVSRIPSMNISKISSYGVILVGIAGGITYLAAMFAPSDDPEIYLTAFNVILFFGAFCFFGLGYGMLKGDEGLTEDA